MCGICGAINLKKNKQSLKLKNIEILKKKIASRGPDAD